MSTMKFFEDQDRAKRTTRKLYINFVIAVFFVIAFLDIFLGFPFILYTYQNYNDYYDCSFFSTPAGIAISVITGISSLVIFGGALFRTCELKSLNGGQVAESLDGRLITSDTRNRQERQLLNIVEEMSIASKVPMPKVYVLDNEGSINAFASGWSIDEAAISVTRGALDYFTRDELQGVIGHEFSHILNGDMTVDMRMIGLLYGLELIYNYCDEILYSTATSKDDGAGVAIPIIMLIQLIGYIGKTAASLTRMAVSRQKEYLADASSVQFTRNPNGIGYALIKISQINVDNPMTNPNAAACDHFFFASIDTILWDSHPPLKKRISKILPDYDGTVPQCVLQDLQDPPGLREIEEDDDDANSQNEDLQFLSVRMCCMISGYGVAPKSFRQGMQNPQAKNSNNPQDAETPQTQSSNLGCFIFCLVVLLVILVISWYMGYFDDFYVQNGVPNAFPQIDVQLNCSNDLTPNQYHSSLFGFLPSTEFVVDPWVKF